MKTPWLAVAFWLGFALIAFAQPRTWTDSSGKFRIQAELVDSRGGEVRLRKTDGQVILVPFDRLSDADQDFIASKAEASVTTSVDQPQPVEVRAKARWSHVVMFASEDRKPKGPPLEIELTLVGEAAEAASAFGQLKLDAVIADDGQQLVGGLGVMKATADEMILVDRADRSRRSSDGDQRIPIQIEHPGRPLKTIAELRGTVVLRTAGTYEEVTISDLGRLLDKPVDHPTLRTLGVEALISRQSEDVIEFDLKGNLQPVVQLELLDAAGNALEPATSSNSGSGEARQLTFGFQQAVPDDAQVKLTLHLDATDVTVPIRLSDIAVPPAPDPEEGPILQLFGD